MQNNNEDYEGFIPYNQHLSMIFVEVVGLDKSTEDGFSDILVVRYEDEEYDLYWDSYNFYYKGSIKHNGKLIEGFIP
jgi:hypothetical protein